jgi:hypothetical protein
VGFVWTNSDSTELMAWSVRKAGRPVGFIPNVGGDDVLEAEAGPWSIFVKRITNREFDQRPTQIVQGAARRAAPQ